MEPEDSSSRRKSILDTLGVDLLSVICPVSISMLLVVILISSISSTTTSPPITTAATLVYQESPSDSTSQKLSGALLNALVFVLLISAVTFLLVLLYYYNFTNFLKNYTRFSSFFVLFSMGGSILISVIVHFSIPIDSISFLLLLFNFSVIGVSSVFSNSFPILLKQGYMVSLGVIVAAWLTRLPEWTTWVLLLALAVYDLVAVLCPGGPLRLLVELASARDDDLPALVYEARPNINNHSSSSSVPAVVLPTVVMADVEMQPVTHSSSSSTEPDIIAIDINDNGEHEAERSPLVNNPRSEMDEEYEEMESTRGIRLGLGDFVFYSVLVGRAAMYDLMTVYACYLVIISGLGCTLILLTVWKKALPALPISITLGVAFYFLTRLLMEPFVVGASTALVMF